MKRGLDSFAPRAGRYAVFAVASWVAVSSLCGCAADSKERVGVARNFRNENAEKQNDGRLVITRRLVETYKLTAEDFAELQLFLHGRILLRREAAAGTREITEKHTLKVETGHVYDEVMVDNDTPGVSISSQELRVNFDPEDPENGFVFKEDGQGKFRLDLARKEGGHGLVAEYGGEHYDVVEGSSAHLEVGAEMLREYVTNQRKLPGTVLPGAEP
jgi:hypothetical protein